MVKVIEITDGHMYFENHRLHREDGPAIVTGRKKAWYQFGLLHRIDGPAVVNSNGTVKWAIMGKEVSFDDWCRETWATKEDIALFRLKYG